MQNIVAATGLVRRNEMQARGRGLHDTEVSDLSYK